MVKLDAGAINELVEILRPFVESEKERQPFLIAALGNQAPVLQHITWSGSVMTFTSHMVSRLADFGGEKALGAVLEYARLQMSDYEDTQKRIDDLQNLINLGSKPINQVLATDINAISMIMLCLNTAEQRRNAGKLSEKQQTEVSAMESQLQPIMDISTQLAEMAATAQKFIRETIQALEQDIEYLHSQGNVNSTQEIEQLKSEKTELENKIKPLEIQLKILKSFEQDLEIGRESAKWLDKNLSALAKRAGNIVLEEYQNIKTDFSSDDIDDFYWEIEKYLERISHCLTWGKYDMLDEPDLQTLPIYAYKKAFNYIKDNRIATSLSKNAQLQLKDCIEYLIQRLS